MSVTNPVPVNVTVSPPYTWPNLGLIDVSKGVEEAWYVMDPVSG